RGRSAVARPSASAPTPTWSGRRSSQSTNPTRTRGSRLHRNEDNEATRGRLEFDPPSAGSALLAVEDAVVGPYDRQMHPRCVATVDSCRQAAATRAGRATTLTA